MAEEWVKVRVSLDSDPKVIAMATWLEQQPDYIRWATGGRSATCSVTTRVTVCVTVTALSRVWSVTRRDGTEDGEDLVVPFGSLQTIDEISQVPGLGQAMAMVGWAVHDPKSNRLIFPKFFRHNASTEELKKKQAAERQRRRRDSLRDRQRDSSVTSRVTVTPMSRTETEGEIEREKDKEKSPPPPSFDERLLALPEVVRPEAAHEAEQLDAAVNELIATWNGLRGAHPTTRTTLTFKQRQSLRGWMFGPDRLDWRAALRKFPLRCFVGDGKFKPTLGWFCEEEHAREVLEGKYDFAPDGDKAKPSGRTRVRLGAPDQGVGA